MVLAPPPPSRDIELRGAPANLFALIRRKEEDAEAYLPDEVLLDGPAGTGKTMGWCVIADYLAWKYPGSRQLFLRQVRRTLADSVLTTFEERVLGPGHPAKHGTATTRNRAEYIYPNGSRIVLGGLDSPEKLFSTEWDVIWFDECIEAALDGWEKLSRSLRWQRMPFQLLVGITNPGPPAHFINKRFPSGVRTVNRADRDRPPFLRLVSKHSDNPSLDSDEGQDYLRRLSQLTGARRSRLYLGEWVGNAGQIYDEWDPAIHLISRDDLPEMSWHFGSGDKGHSQPGVLHIWGVDHKDRMYLVAEVYRCGWQSDQWGGVLVDLHEEFDHLRRVPFDPSSPEYIERFNDMLGVPRGRDAARIVEGAQNDIPAGIDAVKFALSKDDEGVPRLRIVEDCLRFGRDPKRVEEGKATCLVDELPGYVWRTFDDGQRVKEEPDPGCSEEDHALDSLRYACMWKWRKDLREPSIPADPKPGTAAWIWAQDNKRKGA